MLFILQYFEALLDFLPEFTYYVFVGHQRLIGSVQFDPEVFHAFLITELLDILWLFSCSLYCDDHCDLFKLLQKSDSLFARSVEEQQL